MIDKNMNTYVEQAMDTFVRHSLMSDEFLDFVKDNTKPLDSLMAYYRCAIMEVETKFKVLNEQFSLEYDRNPIESIKTRVKSMDGIIKKVRKKELPLTLEAIEENINDIAGVRVVCSFPEDIYLLADCLLRQDDTRTPCLQEIRNRLGASTESQANMKKRETLRLAGPLGLHAIHQKNDF